MSALPPKADVCGATWDVRYGPIADIVPSVDQLVGTGKQGRRDLEAERLGRLQIDHQFELRGLLDRKVGRLCTLEDSLSIRSSPTIQINVIRAIRNQCAVSCRRWEGEDRSQTVIHRGSNQPTSMPEHERARLYDDRHRPICLHCSQDVIRLGDVTNPA